MSKFIKIVLIFTIITLLSGCWDKIEINDRAFISAVGIDLYEENDTEDNKEDQLVKIDEPRETAKNRYSITYVFPNLNAIGKNATSEKMRFVLGSVGRNPFQTTVELSTRSNKVMFFNHMKVVIIGEDVARNSDYMKEILDSLERHDQITRKLILMIAEGTAKDVIEAEPVLEPVTGTFLAGIVEQNRSTSRLNTQNLDDVLINIHSTGNSLIPRVVPGEEEVKVAGSAVIKDYRLVGWLGELENRAIMFFTGRVRSELINILFENITIPFIVTDTSVKKTSSIENGKIKMDYFIEMEGYIQQYKFDYETPLLDKKSIKAIEGEVAKKIENEIKGTIRKIQKEFEVDVLGVSGYLSKFEPDLWESIKDDWEEVFPNVEISVSVDAKLRRIGMTR